MRPNHELATTAAAATSLASRLTPHFSHAGMGGRAVSRPNGCVITTLQNNLWPAMDPNG